MQLQLPRPSCTQDALPARAGHLERMEILLLCRDAPSGKNLNPSLYPRRGISRKHNHLHTEPKVTELLRNKEQGYETVADSATRRSSGKERR